MTKIVMCNYYPLNCFFLFFVFFGFVFFWFLFFFFYIEVGVKMSFNIKDGDYEDVFLNSEGRPQQYQTRTKRPPISTPPTSHSGEFFESIFSWWHVRG